MLDRFVCYKTKIIYFSHENSWKLPVFVWREEEEDSADAASLFDRGRTTKGAAFIAAFGLFASPVSQGRPLISVKNREVAGAWIITYCERQQHERQKHRFLIHYKVQISHWDRIHCEVAFDFLCMCNFINVFFETFLEKKLWTQIDGNILKNVLMSQFNSIKMCRIYVGHYFCCFNFKLCKCSTYSPQNRPKPTQKAIQDMPWIE